MGKGGHLDRQRAARLMNAAGVDALVLLQPENYGYAVGATPGVPALWRRAGAAMAVIPSDAATPAAAVVSDLFAAHARAAGIADVRTHAAWIEAADVAHLLPSNRPLSELIDEADAAAGRPGDLARPATFDARAAFGRLREALAERGLLRARLGIEMDFVPLNDFRLLQAVLPEPEWVDASGIVERLRAVKSPAEIDLLRTACAIGEAGMVAAAEGMRAGQTRADLGAAWRAAAMAEATRRGRTDVTGAWEYTSVGPDPWSGGGTVETGSVVKFDVGVYLAGYSSDSGRTFTWGRTDPHVREVHDALSAAFRAGRAAFRPGATLGDVHRAATAEMARAGFARFSRGHFGHGVGQSVWTEEWPYTAAGSDVVLEPGMLMAFETPFYVTGVGGFIIEDMLLVTDTGTETLNTMPHDLRELG